MKDITKPTASRLIHWRQEIRRLKIIWINFDVKTKVYAVLADDRADSDYNHCENKCAALDHPIDNLIYEPEMLSSHRVG